MDGMLKNDKNNFYEIKDQRLKIFTFSNYYIFKANK